MVDDRKILCAKCGHPKRFHGNGKCKSIGCKGCKAFRLDLSPESFLDFRPRDKSTYGNKNITPYQVAEYLSGGDGELSSVLLSDIIWNPGMYYRAYCDMGGFLSMGGWLMLCQTKRRS